MSAKCHYCDKPVYWNERVLALKKTWHKDCFRCTECDKRIALGSQYENKQNPYCRTCYMKNFGPRGFRGGSSGSMVMGNFDGKTPVRLPSQEWTSSRSLRFDSVDSSKRSNKAAEKLPKLVEDELKEMGTLQEVEVENNDKPVMGSNGNGVKKEYIENDEDSRTEKEMGKKLFEKEHKSERSVGKLTSNTKTLDELEEEAEVSEDEVQTKPFHPSKTGKDFKNLEEIKNETDNINDEEDVIEQTDAKEEKPESFWDLVEKNDTYKYLRNSVNSFKSSWFGQ